MKFWFVFPLMMLMLSPLWLERFESRMARQDGITTAEGGAGIPPRYAEGGAGIPPRYAEGGAGIPPR
jgi:hypothetical protein